jgi:hypothetical protein
MLNDTNRRQFFLLFFYVFQKLTQYSCHKNPTCTNKKNENGNMCYVTKKKNDAIGSYCSSDLLYTNYERMSTIKL